MTAARKRAFNGGSAWRSKAIAAIQICWKQISPDGDRDERLGWIAEYLGLGDLESITDLSDEQLGKVAGEMKRLTGSVGSGQRTVDGGQSGNRTNVVQGDFGREPRIENPKPTIEPETIFLSSPEMVYTLEKLKEYIGWSHADVFEFIRKRVLRGPARLSGSVPNFHMLTFRQANTALNALLHVAAHRDLKIRKGDKPVSRAEVNKYIPLLKEKLRIDR